MYNAGHRRYRYMRISLQNFLNGVKEAYIQDQKEKGMRVTGESANSLTVVETKDGGELIGVGYWVQQYYGRKPGSFPPIVSIQKWIIKRGIKPFNPKTSIKSLAFLFARAIANAGTWIFQKKKPGVNIKDKLPALKNQLKIDIKKELQQIKIVPLIRKKK